MFSNTTSIMIYPRTLVNRNGAKLLVEKGKEHLHLEQLPWIRRVLLVFKRTESKLIIVHLLLRLATEGHNYNEIDEFFNNCVLWGDN